MNDVPTEYGAVADRLRRALVAEGVAIEGDMAAQLNRIDSPIDLRPRDSGPSLLIEIDRLPHATATPKRRLVAMAIAAAIIALLGVVIAIQRRDSGIDTVDEGAPRFFLPESVPDGFVLGDARMGLGEVVGTTPEIWTRIYVQRQDGVIRHALFISTTSNPSGQGTSAQRVTIAGRNAGISSFTFGLYVVFDDLGCGTVTISAVGYDTSQLPPPDLAAVLESTACTPTPSGRQAASISIPRGFNLERDYDALEEAQGQWRMSYLRASSPFGGLGDLQFSFVASDQPLDLAGCACGLGNNVARNGRTYRTRSIDYSSGSQVSGATRVGSSSLSLVVWRDGGNLITLSSSSLTVDDLLSIAEGVREVTKAEFDDAVASADSSNVIRATR